jgi:aminopeptidase
MSAQAHTMAIAPSQEERLDRFAEVAVRVGLGLAPGQELVMTAPLDAVPLVRRITAHAYRAGASLVTTLFEDDEATLLRFQLASEDTFDRATGWLFEGMAAAYRKGAARLAIRGDNPSLLTAQDPERVARANRARSLAYRPALQLITDYAINWTIVSYATPAWAKAMFPDETEEAAVARLWDAIFAASRIDEPDPVAAWDAHNRNLRSRCARLNAKSYAALRFHGPGTDLRVGLADGHEWLGGSTQAQNGVTCNPDRRGLHDASPQSRGRGCPEHEAALVPGHLDPRYRGAVRERPHRRCQGENRRGGPAQGSGDG